MQASDPTPFLITVEAQGWTYPAAPGQTLLQAAEAAGVVLPSSCRNGTCRTCMCRMMAGQVRYLIQWPGLAREEQREGWVLPCVAVAESDCVLEAGAARRA